MFKRNRKIKELEQTCNLLSQGIACAKIEFWREFRKFERRIRSLEKAVGINETRRKMGLKPEETNESHHGGTTCVGPE